MKQSLCLFTDSLEPSGLGEIMLTLASELRKQYRISLVCPPTESGTLVLDRAQRLGLETLALEVRGDRSAWTRLVSWLRTEAITIFHAHAGIGWEGHNGVYAARSALTPVIVRTEHLPDLITKPDERTAYRHMAQRVDQIICVCAEAYASFLDAGVPATKLSIVYNGIEPRVAAPRARAAVRAQLGLPPDAQLLLSVARMTEQKGHRYLLEAVPALVAGAPHVYFVWVGEGPLADELRARAHELGMAERIRFAGRRNDVPELMAAADLLVLPSLFEGLPVVVLEAMSIGLPVVSTQVCGVREAIEDSVHGRLVPARDPQALASAVLEALTQPEMSARWAAAAKTRFAQKFSAARMARETTGIYEALLKARAARQPQRAISNNPRK